MPRVRYARVAGGAGSEDQGDKPSSRKPTMAKDGYEILVDRGERRYGEEATTARELSDVEYEPALRRGGYLGSDDC